MTTSKIVVVAAGVTAALVCAGVGFVAELLLAVWAFRKPGFSSLRVRDWMRRKRTAIVFFLLSSTSTWTLLFDSHLPLSFRAAPVARET